MNRDSKIYIAGHRGLVGSALHRSLERRGFTNLLLRSHAELDLTDFAATSQFFSEERPEYVFLAAAKVGGILANSEQPVDFIRDNLQIQTNAVEACYRSGVKRLLFLGSSCIYPKLCPQPIKEEYLLTGPLEITNRAYALAKIAGIEMCWAYNRQYGTKYLAVMPTNLYGPSDNYDPVSSHVLPALIRKVAEAKRTGASEIVIWGSGTPRRELLYSDDMAEACVFLMSMTDENFDSLLSETEPPLINVGTNEDLTIREIAELVCQVLEHDCELVFDATKPDGTPRKLMDSGKITRLGWRPQVGLAEGIRLAYEQSPMRADMASPTGR